MKAMRIEDVCSFIGGSQPPKSEFVYEEKEGYVRLIQTRDYKSDRFKTYIPSTEAKKKCSKDDVMIGRYGPPVFQILRGLEGAYNVALMKACPKDTILNDYLFYLLKQEKLFRYIEALSSRTGGQTGVDIESLNKYPVMLPDKAYQQKVVDLLKGLDDKISINNQIRKKTEKMIWEMWLYRFCGSKSNYEYRKLSDICRQITESIEPSQYPNQEFAYYSIPNFDATGSFNIEQAKNIKSNKFVVCENDLLVSKLNPWFNRVILADRNSICSTEFVVLRADNSYLRNYIYAIAISQPFVSYCSSNATGTSNSHKRINPDLMMEYKTKYNVDAAETFGKTIAPYIKNIINIVNQNLILASTRDFLLPLLINGQVSMKRKEKEYE